MQLPFRFPDEFILVDWRLEQPLLCIFLCPANLLRCWLESCFARWLRLLFPRIGLLVSGYAWQMIFRRAQHPLDCPCDPSRVITLLGLEGGCIHVAGCAGEDRCRKTRL
ncbi:MAG: hypothetical protein B6D47_00735 [Rhodocyclaceae bacterium UTPRO2]|nr:MAG: hypothetical protein B6D47_00735 [Rhodocyclaceae bacterium UTPRO2]